MSVQEDDGVLAVVGPTLARRVVAVGTLAGSGAVLLYMAMYQTTPDVGTGVLVVAGICALCVAEVIRRATGSVVELTARGLRDSDGTWIVATSDVAQVDRGVLAFKPTHGFVVRTKTSHSPGWRFGLWWRYGRYVGVGGMIPSGPSKAMADRLAQMVLDRDQAQAPDRGS